MAEIGLTEAQRALRDDSECWQAIRDVPFPSGRRNVRYGDIFAVLSDARSVESLFAGETRDVAGRVITSIVEYSSASFVVQAGSQIDELVSRIQRATKIIPQDCHRVVALRVLQRRRQHFFAVLDSLLEFIITPVPSAGR